MPLFYLAIAVGTAAAAVLVYLAVRLARRSM